MPTTESHVRFLLIEIYGYSFLLKDSLRSYFGMECNHFSDDILIFMTLEYNGYPNEFQFPYLRETLLGN